MEEQQKNKRGGKRPNAGRPYKDGIKRKTTCIRLAEDLHAFLMMQPNKTEFVENVLRDYLKRNGITL